MISSRFIRPGLVVHTSFTGFWFWDRLPVE
jgi:hypothetical protein